MYTKQVSNHFVIAVIYVHDILFIGNKEIIKDVKSHLSSQFDTRDIGAAKLLGAWKLKGVVLQLN